MMQQVAPSSPFFGLSLQSDPAAPAALDLRGCAIDVCHLWDQQKAQLKTLSNARGLIRRSDVVKTARAIEFQLEEIARPSQKPLHPDTKAAQEAVVDWIVHEVRGVPKRVAFRSLDAYCRFFWGYLEQTPLYHAYLERRKTGLGKTPEQLSVDLMALQAGRCSMGFAYGAPTLGALRNAQNERGRGRFSQVAINESVWSVMDKNKEAKALVRMALDIEQSRPALQKHHQSAPMVVNDEIAHAIDVMVAPVIAGHAGGPQFIVSRGRQRMRLYLKLARCCNGTRTCGDNALAWRKNPYGLFQAIEDIVFLNFIPSKGSDGKDRDWGTFEQLHWHLEPVDPTRRRHQHIFRSTRNRG